VQHVSKSNQPPGIVDASEPVNADMPALLKFCSMSMASPVEERGRRILVQQLKAAEDCLLSLEHPMVIAARAPHRKKLLELHRSARLAHARCTSFLLTYLQSRFFAERARGFRGELPVLMGQSRAVGSTATLLLNMGSDIPSDMPATREKWSDFCAKLRTLSKRMTEATADDGLMNLREDS
jgi:hypothetical protein